MGKKKAPPPPDYKKAAAEQEAANLKAASYQTALDRPTEIDPYQSRTWALKSGADPKNPKAGDWVVKTTLNAGQQSLYDQNLLMSRRGNAIALNKLQDVGRSLGSPFDMSQVRGRSQFEAPTSMDAFSADRDEVQDALYRRQTRYIDPMRDQGQKSMDAQLAAQGLGRETRAYSNSQRNFDDRFGREYSDARDFAITNADQTQAQRLSSMIAAGQAQDQGRQSDIEQQAFLRSLPLNELNALRAGGQVSAPQFQAWNQAQGYQAAPIYQATQDGYNAQMQAYNAQVAQRGQLLGTISTVAGAALGGPLGASLGGALFGKGAPAVVPKP